MKKVLISDDNSNNRYLLERLLTASGYAVEQAKNGAEALELARNGPPDLIITDLLMPVMDGFELCRRWKSDDLLKNVPFVVYTATYTEPKDEQLVIKLGADKFLIKPQKPEALLEVVQKILSETNGGFIANKPPADDMEALKSYNEVLFHKLEKKMASLEKEILERTIAERKLSKMVTALEKSNAELEKFAYATSHDLQDPLRMVSLYVQLLKKKLYVMLDAESREYIDVVVKGANGANEMIKNIIDYSKFGIVEKDFGPVDLNVTAKNTMENFASQIKEINADIRFGMLPTVNGDALRLERLFQNLVGNALKFHKKDVILKLEITVSKKDGKWLFCFKDNGIGISPKYFDKIFVIFQTLHPKDEYGGNGIGLALCKKIVEGHGGNIWVESEEGDGAAFYFTLPIIKS
jgi:signal transduction histidine kinase